MPSPNSPGPEGLDLATLAISAGRGAHAPGAPVAVPPVLSAVFRHAGQEGPPAYARETNPTWEALEEALGALEGGRAMVFASGLAAIAAVIDSLDMGARVVAPRDAYTGTRALLDDLASRGRLDVTLVDIADTDAVGRACEGAALLWIESPTNPLLDVADTPALVEAAHRAGAAVAMDSTFATPLLQRPLHWGVDVVVHSATKLLAGHSDVILGAAITRDEEWLDALRRRRLLHGAIPGPVEAWLVLRGLRTLPVRLRAAQENAGELARRLAGHPGVVSVRYPGLPEDPWHDRARRLMAGFGTVVSFELLDAARADAACAAVRLVEHVTSLGGVETTMERRNRQPGEDHAPEGLIRLSVGCEHVEDVWSDLVQALDVAMTRP
jgi:cystathionine gamma-synthase